MKKTYVWMTFVTLIFNNMEGNMEHRHLIIRAEVLEPPKSILFIERWLINLVIDMGMKVAAGPVVSYITKKGNRGLTAAILIETSHIVIHVWDELDPALIQLDIYTCSPLDVEEAVGKINPFKPIKVEYKFLDRNENLIIIEEKIKNGDRVI